MQKQPEKSHEHHFGAKDLHTDKPGLSEDDNNNSKARPYGHFHPHSDEKGGKS